MTQEYLYQKISELKREKNAVVLVHNYQLPEVQLAGDHLGDSLELAKISAKLDKDLIVFAGVDFMAEMAAILNPGKKVVIPDTSARCPMAAQLPADKVRKAKDENPGAPVVLYVNTLAEAKAEADVICTSANAPQIVGALEEERVLFGPDRNLAWFAEKRTSKKVIPIPEDGHCYVHRMFSLADIQLLKEQYPDAEVLVHPECDPEVQQAADHICSTSQMSIRARASPSKRFIIGTEIGMIDRLRREFPDKEFIPALGTAVCQQMKKHTLEKVYESLRDEKHVVTVPDDIAVKSRAAIDRMLDISGRAASD